MKHYIIHQRQFCTEKKNKKQLDNGGYKYCQNPIKKKKKTEDLQKKNAL